MLSKIILTCLDFFYPLFKRFLPLQTYRYAACGGGNTLLSLGIFFVGYNFIFRKQVVHFSILAFEPHIAAMILAFVSTFPLGFYMSRNIVFSGSALRGRHQLFRYFSTALGAIALNYVNLKILVEKFHVFPTVAQIINTVIVVVFSYIMQKHFAFKTEAKAL